MSTATSVVSHRLRLLRTEPSGARVESLLDRVGVGDGYGRTDSPLGTTWVAFNDHGVAFAFVTDDEAEFRSLHDARLPRRLRAAAVPHDVAEALAASDGSALTVDLRHCAPFQREVLTATRSVPLGQTRSYGWVAEQIGNPNAVRAVGTALGTNPVPLVIPCHRIVRSDGQPGAYLFGADRKQKLLTLEAS
jgi:methylated-DNA-[protein]-cysteine S-methyltransferase